MDSMKSNDLRNLECILVANRGEISCRIQKTCHRLGIKTIAVGSTVDEGAAHMQMADFVQVVGAAESTNSYLNGKAIIDTALKHSAQAIHPGYGFLSENPNFASVVREAGLIFIGPSHEAMSVMASKVAAKRLAESAKVPTIPGYMGHNNYHKEAQKIGFPLFIKATYGGGGKGIRRVDHLDDLDDALAACQREAAASFGNDEVMLEKYLINPRHVEVQILGDQYGKCVVLSDRDCSLQRRHQKIIEEAPAPNLSNPLRERLHQAALAIARQVNYEGLGTVEFLVDNEDHFYFLEMNTRLQVEHPITEMILGLDLVEWQIRVAAGEHLSLDESKLVPHGHAVEVRLYAEDGENQFLPSTGKITKFEFPMLENARIDTGLREGDEVTLYYDPLIAKLITWGSDRNMALKLMHDALSQTRLGGIKTNLHFLQDILVHPYVMLSTPDVGFVDRYIAQKFGIVEIPKHAYLLAVLWMDHFNSQKMVSPWVQHDGWRMNGPTMISFHFTKEHQVSLRRGINTIVLSDVQHAYQVTRITVDEHNMVSEIEGQNYNARVYRNKDAVYVYFDDEWYVLTLSTMALLSHHASTGSSHLTAPMPGRIVSVMVAMNDIVEPGQSLLILEAMKMEHTIRAPYAGVVEELPFSVGEVCEEGAELIRLRES
jgi:3-methylcrotonyl-CoA carboxylase alpha subunit